MRQRQRETSARAGYVDLFSVFGDFGSLRQKPRVGGHLVVYFATVQKVGDRPSPWATILGSEFFYVHVLPTGSELPCESWTPYETACPLHPHGFQLLDSTTLRRLCGTSPTLQVSLLLTVERSSERLVEQIFNVPMPQFPTCFSVFQETSVDVSSQHPPSYVSPGDVLIILFSNP